MDNNTNLPNTISLIRSQLSAKRDLYLKNLKDKTRKEAIGKKRNLVTQNDPSILAIVRKKMETNFNTLPEDKKHNPANLLEGIPKDEILAGLMVRAEKLLESFAIVEAELPRIEQILQGMINECRDAQYNYYSPEALAKTRRLVVPVRNCQSLLTYIDAFSHTLQSGQPLLISTSIIGAGVLKEKVEKMIQDAGSEGIDTQALKEANQIMEDALEGVPNYEFQIKN